MPGARGNCCSWVARRASAAADACGSPVTLPGDSLCALKRRLTFPSERPRERPSSLPTELKMSDHRFACAFCALALDLNHRMSGPEASSFRGPLQAACDQFRGRFLDCPTQTADHKDYGLTFCVAMIAGEEGGAGGQPMDTPCFLQEFEGTVDLNGLHLPRTAKLLGDLVGGNWFSSRRKQRQHALTRRGERRPFRHRVAAGATLHRVGVDGITMRVRGSCARIGITMHFKVSP